MCNEKDMQFCACVLHEHMIKLPGNRAALDSRHHPASDRRWFLQKRLASLDRHAVAKGVRDRGLGEAVTMRECVWSPPLPRARRDDASIKNK